MAEPLEIEIPMEVEYTRWSKRLKRTETVVVRNPIAKTHARQVFRNKKGENNIKVRSYNTPRTEAAEQYLRGQLSKYKEEYQEFVKVGIAGKAHGNTYKAYIPVKFTVFCFFIKNDWIPVSITIPTLRTQGDWNALGNLVTDAMGNILIAEDRQISDARVVKRWSERPYGDITIRLEEDKL